MTSHEPERAPTALDRPDVPDGGSVVVLVRRL